jgi:hypothetical protein
MSDLFEQLLQGGEAAVLQLIKERRQEGVDLDFKTSRVIDGRMDKEDRKNLGTILSAFSNSMGGIVVWGVDARKVEGIDCASEAKPIPQIEKFKSDATRRAAEAIMPRHEGVRVEAIPAKTSPGSGYLVIFVPRSERRPHRSEFGEKVYYKRAGDSSFVMEHYDVEDSFKRLVVPWIDVTYTIQDAGHTSGPDGEFGLLDIHLTLTNPSAVSARFPYLIIASPYEGVRPHAFPARAEDGEWHFTGGADHVIHPGLAITAARVSRKIKLRTHRLEPVLRPGSLKPIVIDYRCGCFNSRQTSGQISIPPDELANAVGGYLAAHERK